MSAQGGFDTCRRCGRVLDGRDDSVAATGLCLGCAVSAAESRIGLDDATPLEVETPVERKRSLVARGTLAAVAVATAALAWLGPGILAAAQTEQPDRLGTMETDTAADECIENLAILMDAVPFQIVQDVQMDLACPLTGARYRVELAQDSKNIARASCPNPEEHGLSAVYIEAGDEVATVEE